MEATCLCGAVSIDLPERPTSVTFCNCSMCRKQGAVWAYFPRGTVKIAGGTQGCLRQDVEDPMVEVHSCTACGVTTHWIATAASGVDRMGANMRLFHPDEVAGMEARFFDGLGWDGVSDPQERRPPGIVGEDVLIA